ncbi:M48 family peptidase [Aliishimia ponticola]|uniref:M48 family peptidase n=1 Tax=Aliishimia ponticola TaxID=2499833 RepID=A0A4S4NKX2_9RHOB|nr:SprT family zinc-dependent metalloprotease [Aliishimia ponticola]THH36790.1 M48 family peptidase [Aliishimia ponticola]
MSNMILQGEPPVEVTIRRSARARRMTLRVSRMDGRVTLTLPRGASEAEARAFAGARADWIRKHLAETAPHHGVGIGSDIPILGEMRHIVPGAGRRVVLQDSQIAIPGPPDQAGRKLEAWLKQTARSKLAYASDQYAQRLGREYSRITLRDTRSRWGSCSSAGALMYSWRLIMAPAEVLTYVAAHEVAHLAEMNHSKAFWDTVQRIYGDYDAARGWLRADGHRLHQYRF